MTGIEYLNSEDCPNIKVGMGLDQIQMYVIAGILEAYAEKQLLLHNVSQQRELLEWLSNEDYFNIPKDEISEILEDWQTYNSNCG